MENKKAKHEMTVENERKEEIEEEKESIRYVKKAGSC